MYMVAVLGQSNYVFVLYFIVLKSSVQEYYFFRSVEKPPRESFSVIPTRRTYNPIYCCKRGASVQLGGKLPQFC